MVIIYNLSKEIHYDSKLLFWFGCCCCHFLGICWSVERRKRVTLSSIFSLLCKNCLVPEHNKYLNYYSKQLAICQLDITLALIFSFLFHCRLRAHLRLYICWRPVLKPKQSATMKLLCSHMFAE